MVYVDILTSCLPNRNWRWDRSCHLVADTPKELHQFATRLGLRLSWFQIHPRCSHYDLTAGMRAKAVRLGAVELTQLEYARKFLGHVPAQAE